MDCGIPFCHEGCPVNNVIPDWNHLVYESRWRQALDVLHSTNNFPEVTGRICPAPCEEACTLNLIDSPVTIKTIECSIADRGWSDGWIAPQPASRKTGRRVAVVGSGPSGLACAQQLARAGHAVEVFEKNDRIGGLLRYGIPDFKMEKGPHRPADATDGGRGSRVPAGGARGSRYPGAVARRRVRCGGARGGRGAASRSARRGARSGGSALRDGVPAPAEPAGGGRRDPRGSRRSPPRASTSW